jgi:hypothetical protein
VGFQLKLKDWRISQVYIRFEPRLRLDAEKGVHVPEGCISASINGCDEPADENLAPPFILSSSIVVSHSQGEVCQ